MESPASASPSLPEGEVLADFLVFLDDAAAAAAAAEPYEVEMEEEEEEEPQEVEFAADDGSDDDVGGDLVGNGGLMEDEVDYAVDELVDADSEDGSLDIMADDGDDEAATEEEHATRAAEPPAATARNARMSVKPVKQFGGDYEAINEMIREYLQADKKRRRARRVAAAMLRLRRQRRRPAEDGGAPTWP
ncbi:Os07g0203400 [Oryza sativa Japonica Group]|uniref:Uncharacterized protein n=2 Tax=Oryza sativa subsp. japonica TaxID=39947 RepID=Q69RS9_ORYSJ|nr:hypothetical protein [Oryza sativa Japonica Group]BAD31016.1 hypothetical protein [Oryza sativa Japonica Group]BAT00520.1 Os07g0203400 [Oryza sativa Japonica Group]